MVADVVQMAEEESDGSDGAVPLANGDDQGEPSLREHRHLFRKREQLVVVRDQTVPVLRATMQCDEEFPVVDVREGFVDLHERDQLDVRHHHAERSEHGRGEVLIEGEAQLPRLFSHHAARTARFASS
jgi:hypothetical protein